MRQQPARFSCLYSLLLAVLVVVALPAVSPCAAADSGVPNILGTWSGPAIYSEDGSTWPGRVTITLQQGSHCEGYTYMGQFTDGVITPTGAFTCSHPARGAGGHRASRSFTCRSTLLATPFPVGRTTTTGRRPAPSFASGR